ncbi:MAG: PQQ-binding-like beta-propeller repeat protein [Acidobacteriota bacterium]
MELGDKHIDNRAGNECDVNNRNASCLPTDEDHTEGFEMPWGMCDFRETKCFAFAEPLAPVTPGFLNIMACTKDHFQPRLPLPLNADDAIWHAHWYFDIAVRNYKASLCNPPFSELYRKGAARALGHVLHLAGDMGSPQHVRPENHGPFPLGNGPSFLEYWSSDLWGRAVPYPPEGEGEKRDIGHFDTAALRANAPLLGDLFTVFDLMAKEGARFADQSPYRPGHTLLYGELARVLADSKIRSTFLELTQPVTYDLLTSTIVPYPSYFVPSPDDSKPSTIPHTYGSPLFAEPDFVSGVASSKSTIPVEIASFELALRLWAEKDPEHPQHPIDFDNALKTLLEHTTNASAGVILAFWEEVRDFQCPCEDLRPCDLPHTPFRQRGAAIAGAQSNPRCDPPPAPPYTPGRDSPDDNAGVLAAAPAAPLATGDVSDTDSAWSLNHWERVAALGIEKNVTSLCDFGRAMWLAIQGAEPALPRDELDEESATAIAHEIGELSTKYQTERRRPEDDIPTVARVAVLEAGFHGGAAALLDRLGHLYVTVGHEFDPLAAAEAHPLLLVPSGGLYGAASSAALRERFAAYVEAGGTLLVMAQMHGRDFDAVPVPAGETLHGWGWYEDQSCWRDNVRLAAAHPAMASGWRDTLSLPVDGSFDAWPGNATVLLRRVNGGMAALLTYPIGAGRVVVSSSFEDWAEGNTQTSTDGLALISDLISWGLDPARERPSCQRGTACTTPFSTAIANRADDASDVVEWRLVDSLGRPALHQPWRQSLTLQPGEERTVSLVPPLPTPPSQQSMPAGIYHLRYRLIDSARTLRRLSGAETAWSVQTEAEAGQFVLHAWPQWVQNLPSLGVAATLDSEIVAPHTRVPLHLSVRNFGAAPFAGTARVSYMAPGVTGWTPLGDVSFEVPAGGLHTATLTVGPMLLQAGHDGLPGGATIRVEVFAEGAPVPSVTATRNVLTNVRYLDTTLVASDPQAGPGDTVEFAASVVNRSMGRVEGLVRYVYRNFGNLGGAAPEPVRDAWQPFALEAGQTGAFAGSFEVPSGWQGTLQASLHTCFEDQPCWTSGNELDSDWFVHRTQVALPLPAVELSPGDIAPVAGPAFRLPVRVRNVGFQPIAGGRVRLKHFPFGDEVVSDTFDLARGATLDLVLDLPFDPGTRPDIGQWPLALEYTDPLWAAYRPGEPWAFRLGWTVRYGASLAPAARIEALHGHDALRGRVVLENRSTFPRTFTMHLSCAELGYDETRDVSVPAQQKAPFDLVIPIGPATPYGLYRLDLQGGDGQLLDLGGYSVLAVASPGPVMDIRLEGEPRAGATLQGTARLTPWPIAAPLAGTLAIVCPISGLAESRPVTLTNGATTVETFAVALPADVGPGNHLCTLTWSQPNGHIVSKDAWFVVPDAHYAIRQLTTEAEEGGAIRYEVTNNGGVQAAFVPVWTLRTGATVVATDTAVLDLAPGQQETFEFGVPAGVLSGVYATHLEFLLPSGETGHFPGEVRIAGVEAQISVATDRTLYVRGDPITGWADIANGPRPLTGATVKLEVLIEQNECSRPTPWSSYQGRNERTGSSPECTVITGGYDEIDSESGLDSDEVLAAGAGHLSGSGGDEVAAFERSAAGQWAISVFSGFAKVATFPIPIQPSSAAVTIADADSDDQAEVYAADVSAGSVTLRRLTSSLALEWETSLGPAGPEQPFPAGGPLAANLDDDAPLEVVVSTGADLVALDAQTGAEIWRMSQTAPELGDGRVNGFATSQVVTGGSDEIVLSFVADAAPEAGLVVALGGDGARLWSATLAAPVAGSPVVVTAESHLPRVAAVEKPASSSTPGALVLLEGADGSLIWRTATPFWSAWQPSAGDLDGDGEMEFVVAAGDVTCPGCTRGGVIAFESDGSTKWSRTGTSVVAPAPALIANADGLGASEVLFQFRSNSDGSMLLWVVDGLRGSWMAWGGRYYDPTGRPLTLLSIGGGCHAYVLENTRYFHGVPPPPNSPEPNDKPHEQGTGTTIWQWEGPVELAAGETQRFQQIFTLGERTGVFRFVATLRSALGRTIARGDQMFQIEWPWGVVVNLDPIPAALPHDVPLAVSGAIHNRSNSYISGTVHGAIDTFGCFQKEVSWLAPGDFHLFSFETLVRTPGEHRLWVFFGNWGVYEAWASAVFRSEFPRVTATLEAPLAAGSDPIPVVARLVNPTVLPLDLDVTLDSDTGGTLVQTAVHLEPGAVREIAHQVALDRDTRLHLLVAGDAASEKEVLVAFDARPSLDLLSASAIPAGAAVLTLRAFNGGSQPFAGTLDWSATGAVAGAGSAAVRLDPEGWAVIDLPVAVIPGQAMLEATLGQHRLTVPLLGYLGGAGTIELSAPSLAVEGPVLADTLVRSLLPETTCVTALVEAVAQPGGEVAASATRGVTVPAGGESAASVVLSLPPGTYLLRASIAGDASSLAELPIEVRPRHVIALDASAVPPDADGMIGIAVTAANTGAETALGQLAVSGPVAPTSTPLDLDPGVPAQALMTLEPGGLPDGAVTVLLRFLDGAGAVLAERAVPLTVTPAALEVVAPPTRIEGDAGHTVALDVPIANRGLRAACWTLLATAADGAVFDGAASGFLAGGQAALAHVDVPLPQDQPTSALPLRWTVLAQPAGPDAHDVAASGVSTLAVRGVPVTVAASLDRHEAEVGDSVALTLDISGPGDPLPLVAVVTHGDHLERREIEVSVPTSQLFSVPIDALGLDLAWGLYWPSGRAIHLDQTPIRAGSGDLVLLPDKPEYLPGETAAVSASFVEGAILEAVGFASSVELEAPGTMTFAIPPDTPRGRHPIVWTLHRPGPDGPLNGVLDVPVRGPRVRITSVEVSPGQAQPGQPVEVTVRAISDTAMPASLRGWLVAPSGASAPLGQIPVQLEADTQHEAAFTVAATTAEPGTHALAVALDAPSGERLANAAAPLDVGDGRVLGVRVRHRAYPVTDERPVALVTVQGAGAAELALAVDGAEVSRDGVALSGVSTIQVPLPDLEAGWHDLDATMVAGGLPSSASTRFLVARPPTACSAALAAPSSLWPADGAFVPVEILTGAGPDAGRVQPTVTEILQDEPVDGLSDRDAAPDATLAPLTLRAERDDAGNGRVYHIRFRLDGDKDGCTGEVLVCVPLVAGQPCADGGALYDATRR